MKCPVLSLNLSNLSSHSVFTSICYNCCYSSFILFNCFKDLFMFIVFFDLILFSNIASILPSDPLSEGIIWGIFLWLEKPERELSSFWKEFTWSISFPKLMFSWLDWSKLIFYWLIEILETLPPVPIGGSLMRPFLYEWLPALGPVSSSSAYSTMGKSFVLIGFWLSLPLIFGGVY